MKLRIIEISSENGSERKKKFKIQQKRFWGWKTLWNTNGITYEELKFDTYKETEQYMYDKFFRFGESIKNGNVYKYSQYTMYY